MTDKALGGAAAVAAGLKAISCSVTFKGSITTAQTKFLKADPIVMDCTCGVDLDPVDAANLANLQKCFQSEMERRLKEQAGHLNKWLQEKDNLIDSLVKRHEALKKEGFPATEAAAKARAQQLQEMEKLAKQIDSLENDYRTIVTNWATGFRQDLGAPMLIASRNARLKRYNQKAFRVRAAQAIKVTLVLIGIGAAIATIVFSAGATAPLFIGLAAAGATLTGISSLAGLGKSLVANATIEKKLMANLAKDVEVIKNALKPLDNTKTSLGKHVDELTNLIKIREGEIVELSNEVAKHAAAVKGYKKALDELKKDPTMTGEIAKRQKNIGALDAKLQSTFAQIKKLQQANGKGQEMLNLLKSMNVELDKISGQSANSVSSNMKEYFTSLSAVTDLGSLLSSASGLNPG